MSTFDFNPPEIIKETKNNEYPSINNIDTLCQGLHEKMNQETSANITEDEKRTDNLQFDEKTVKNSIIDNYDLLKTDKNSLAIKYKDNSLTNPDYEDNSLNFLLPQYGVQDFINERANWQKGVHNLTGEPGWFYFKLFFHFNDTKGLFGGIMNDTIPNTCALRYLYGIRDFYKYDKIYDRMLALARFTFTLSYINSVSPWFFTGVSGLNKLNGIKTQDLGKPGSIDIVCNTESIDMRLNTLLDMYKYACYDEINMKEIIPENLRKFDMSIVIMNVPIKYFQTGILVSGQDSSMNQIGSNGDTILNKAISGLNKVTSFLNGSDTNYFDYKTVSGQSNSLKNRLSFQMYTLKNCEIDPISFENYMVNSMNNSQFSKMGNSAIKINYDRSYKHTFNEWTQMMFGSDGISYDSRISDLSNESNRGTLLTKVIAEKEQDYNSDKSIPDAQTNRINAIKNSIYNSFFDKDTEAYKGLIDFSETVIEDSLINTTDPTFLGNIGIDYDEKSYEDLWNKTKSNISKFIN